MDKEEATYNCSLCGGNGPFSNRQRNRAMFGKSAKCKNCIQQEDETTLKTEELKGNHLVNEKEKEEEEETGETKEEEKKISGGEEISDTKLSSMEQPIPKVPKKEKKKKSKKSKKSKKDKKHKKQRLEFSDGESVDDHSPPPSSPSVSSSASKSADDAETPMSVSLSNLKVPKNEKKNKQHKRQRLEFSDGESVDDNGSSSSSSHSASKRSNDAETPMSVSLNDLKQKILGREINNEDDDSCMQNLEEAKLSEIGASNTSVATSLQRDLSCAICHEPFYQPISLPCGHTCCQECLDWWFGQNTSCPTCRQAVPCPRASLKVNTALRACVVALFGKDLVARIEAKRQSTAGEHGGAHSRGYESISPMAEEVWRSLNVKGGGMGDCVKVRRSIVLDAEDQRMQLALAVYDTPEKLEDGFRVQICLITMEEDEATDGFPITVCDAEDEHFICTREDRFQISTCLEVRMKTDAGRVVPVARLGLSQANEHGAVEFCLNRDSAPSNYHEVSSLLFSHNETGAELEIDLALMRKGASGGKFVPAEVREQRAKPIHSSCVYDEEDEDEMGDQEEEFEDDGFVVGDDHDSDMEGNFSSDEEEHHDVCCICNDGGELMICDGGEELKGCDKSFHVACVGRKAIPDGDWVCSGCANACGFDVGKEGHEFPSNMPDGSDEGKDCPVLDKKTDTSNEKKRKFTGSLEDSSDEEDFGNGNESSSEPAKINPSNLDKQSAKRRVIDDSDSDDD